MKMGLERWMWPEDDARGIARLREELDDRGVALFHMPDALDERLSGPAFLERILGRPPRSTLTTLIKPQPDEVKKTWLQKRAYPMNAGPAAPHMDSPTGSPVPPQLQIMICRRAASEGGESFIVDIWGLLEDLKDKDPELLDQLFDVPRAVKISGRDYHGPTIALRQDTLVLLDGSAIEPHADPVGRRLYPWLDSAPKVMFRPERGDVYVNNNHRTLHGRAAFTDESREFLRFLAWPANPLGAPTRWVERARAAAERPAAQPPKGEYAMTAAAPRSATTGLRAEPIVIYDDTEEQTLDDARLAERWRRFAKRYWELDAPYVLRGSEKHLLPTISSSELFEATVAFVEDYRVNYRRVAQKGPPPLRFHVDSHQLDVSPGHHVDLLPQRADGSFESYDARLKVVHGIADYCLILGQWHRFSRATWPRLLACCQHLTETVGTLPSRMDTQLFIGTYRSTPFGIHTDKASAFHVPVIGSKTMRFWPGTQQPPLSPEDATQLTAHPGEALYWPSSLWHVANSDGELSVTWGLGYWHDDPDDIGLLIHTLEDVVKASTDRTPVRSLNANVDERVDTAMRRLELELRAGTARQRLARQLLAWRSAYNLRGAPPALEPCADGWHSRVALQRNAMFPVLFTSLRPSAVCLAAGGQTLEFQGDRAKVQALLELVDAKTCFTIRECHERVADEDLVREVVGFLRSAGSVEVTLPFLDTTPGNIGRAEPLAFPDERCLRESPQ